MKRKPENVKIDAIPTSSSSPPEQILYLQEKVIQIQMELDKQITKNRRIKKRTIYMDKLNDKHVSEFTKLEKEQERQLDELEKRHSEELDHLSNKHREQVEELESKQEQETEELRAKYYSDSENDSD
jgi:tRNA G18 (ribose-2'-O)-methylase SpoU